MSTLGKQEGCPKCGVRNQEKPRWFGVPRNLFILNGRIRARGAAGGSTRVYGWEIERVWYPTMFGRSVRHVDRIICPNPWHTRPTEKPETQAALPRQHKSAEERREKALAKRRRSDKR